jgi:voltage-gated potassium channel
VASTAGQISYEDLAPKERRRLLFRHLLRVALSTVVLVVLYYVLPLGGGLHGSAIPIFAIGSLALAVLVTRQVRSIMASDYPRLRGIEVLLTIFPCFLLLCAATYFALARATPHAFSQPLNRTDALYFTVTVFATVGFGDITATTTTTRLIVTIQMLLDLVILGAGFKLLLGAVQMGLKRKSATPTQDTARPVEKGDATAD